VEAYRIPHCLILLTVLLFTFFILHFFHNLHFSLPFIPFPCFFLIPSFPFMSTSSLSLPSSYSIISVLSNFIPLLPLPLLIASSFHHSLSFLLLFFLTNFLFFLCIPFFLLFLNFFSCFLFFFIPPSFFMSFSSYSISISGCVLFVFLLPTVQRRVQCPASVNQAVCFLQSRETL
jgi:hypothetical protein